ncbi:MAG TPA: hypothetical protein VFG79_08985, partial [Solirubrobacter sp.]|nr:hypothetical protein [Solirubrobacter sp.]
VPPSLAGAASGVLNTTRQLGSVFGGAAVGALLQHELAADLHDEATARAGALPAQFRDRFVEGFSNASSGGLEVGAGQTGGALHLPPEIPARVAQEIGQAATAVFHAAFTSAMRVSLLLPVAVLLAASLACLKFRQPRHVTAARERPRERTSPLLRGG